MRPNAHCPTVRSPNIRCPIVRSPSVRCPNKRCPNIRCPDVLKVSEDMKRTELRSHAVPGEYIKFYKYTGKLLNAVCGNFDFEECVASR